MKAAGFVRLCVLVLLISVVLPVPACQAPATPDSQGDGLSVGQKIDDFRFLFTKIADYYPYLELKKRVEGFNWLAHRAEFEKMVRDSKDDEGFAKAIGQIVDFLNNCHTHIMSGSFFYFYKNDPTWWEEADKTTPEKVDYWDGLAVQASQETGWPPFIAEYVGGEYVVTSVAPDGAISSKVRPGFRVLGVNGIPVHEYVASHRGLWFLPYDVDRKILFESRLRFSEEPRTVEFMDSSGEHLVVDVGWAGSAWGTFRYNSPQTYAGAQGILATTIKWRGVEVGCVSVPMMKTDWQSDTEQLRRFFLSISHLPALIIDIRGNSGGNSQYWSTNLVEALDGPKKSAENTFYVMRTKLVEDLQRPVGETKQQFASRAGLLKGNVPKEIWGSGFSTPEVYGWPGSSSRDSVSFAGKIYILTSRANVSAAESFAAYCKTSGFATLVGTTTGGDGLSLMPGLIVLPNSGMAIRFTRAMGLNPDFTANEEFHTKPDVAVEQSLEDLRAWLDSLDKNGFPTGPMPSCDTTLRTCLELIAKSQVQ
jgi:C-terminal processing protease CtpA/Prc